MSISENLFIFIGNAGKKPELKATNGGNPYAIWSIAVDASYKPKDSDEWVNKVNWFNLIAYGKLAEMLAEKLAKGESHYVTGSIDNNTWTDKEGNERKTDQYKVRKVVLTRKSSGGHDISEEVGPVGDDKSLATF